MELLERENQKDREWKCKVAQLGLGLTSLILTTRFISDLFLIGFYNPGNYITLLAGIFYGSLFLYVKKKKTFRNPIFLAIISAFLVIQVRAEMTGGLSSPIMAWFPILPILSSFLLSRKQTYLIGFFSIASVLSMNLLPLSSLFNLEVVLLPAVSKVLMYCSLIGLSTILCLANEDKKNQMLNQIEKQRASMINSSRYNELGEMAAGIAHEINNPLTVIKVKAKKIKRCVENGQDEQDIIMASEKILIMSERINKIIKSMKMLSKSSKNLKSEKDRESLNTILNDVLVLCETKITYSEITLKIDRCKSVPDLAHVPSQLGHVFLNLISNSCDAVSLLKEKWIKINIEKDGNFLVFSFIDSGSGIEKDKRDKVFNPFYSDKVHGLGKGLGLSMNRSMIESFGGKFYLDSKHPHTCFKIILPLHQIDQVSAPKAA